MMESSIKIHTLKSYFSRLKTEASLPHTYTKERTIDHFAFTFLRNRWSSLKKNGKKNEIMRHSKRTPDYYSKSDIS